VIDLLVRDVRVRDEETGELSAVDPTSTTAGSSALPPSPTIRSRPGR